MGGTGRDASAPGRAFLLFPPPWLIFHHPAINFLYGPRLSPAHRNSQGNDFSDVKLLVEEDIGGKSSKVPLPLS